MNSKMVLSKMGPRKIKNVPPWSYSRCCCWTCCCYFRCCFCCMYLTIYLYGGASRHHISTLLNTYSRSSSRSSSSSSSRSIWIRPGGGNIFYFDVPTPVFLQLKYSENGHSILSDCKSMAVRRLSDGCLIDVIR